MSLVLDTGPLYAIADRDDAQHASCLELLEGWVGPMWVPAPVVVESAWLIGSRLGATAEASFLRSVLTRELSVEDLTDGDYARCAELIETYADLPLGFVDAAVMAVAERLGIGSLATVDRRHFSVVRPRHVEAFELLP